MLHHMECRHVQLTATLFGYVWENTQRYTFCYVWFMGALKKIPSSDVICADVRLVNISHQFDLSCWCFLGSHAYQLAVSLISSPQTWEDAWCNKWSDGNVIIEWMLRAIWYVLEIFSPFFNRIMLDTIASYYVDVNVILSGKNKVALML